MSERERRGSEIAARLRIERKGDTWIVPSQGGNGKYTVDLSGGNPTCTCPDHELRGNVCKHIFAVLLRLREQQQQPDEPQDPGPPSLPERQKRPTYRQNWPAYNAAQTNEKRQFLALLRDLCAGVAEPEQRMGRPRLSRRDMIFCAALKVYTGFSGRRLMSDLADAHEKGHIERAPHYNSVFNHLENADLTAVLQSLITESSLALKAVEVDFAVDASGFRVSGYVRWFNAKYGHEQDNQDWRRMHLMTGVKTNIVTAVEISGRDAHESPFFPGLVDTTARHFTLAEVSADKGYCGRANTAAVERHGAAAFIAYRKNAGDPERGSELWRKMYHLYQYNRDEFLGHYHKRSNVESTFSMMKAKFGERITSKGETAIVNEALVKVLCHNICVVIQSMHELGIEPTFWAGSSVAQKVGSDLPLAQEGGA